MILHHTTQAKLARAGMVLLVLSPLSLISFTLQSLIALATLMLPLPRQAGAQIDSATRPDILFKLILLVYMLTFMGTSLSIAELVYEGQVGIGDILARAGGQQVALLLGFFQVVSGFFMAQRYGDQHVRRAIMIPFVIIICVAAYQLISLATGLPFIGKLVADRFVGLRPSSLAVEPKYLASYLACIIFYLGFRLFETALAARSVACILLAAALYFFVAASSANGAIIFVLLLALVPFVLPGRWRWTLIVLAVVGVQAALLQLDAESLGLRETHKDLLTNISVIDLSLLDDLIALPLLAWMDNPGKVIVGFGPGLMHFFAAQYADYATWWVAESYIEGNVSFLMYASNFGLLLYLVLLIGIIVAAVAKVRNPPPHVSISTVFFFASAFVAGAVVTGNISVPFFVAIGWIFGSQAALRRAPTLPPYSRIPEGSSS
jgi:hypothetical protein